MNGISIDKCADDRALCSCSVAGKNIVQMTGIEMLLRVIDQRYQVEVMPSSRDDAVQKGHAASGLDRSRLVPALLFCTWVSGKERWYLFVATGCSQSVSISCWC